MSRTSTSARGTTIPWLAVGLCTVVLSSGACFRRSTLPAALNNQELWRLIETLSEPAGAFTLSDNLVSNEPHFADAVRWLRPTGGAYIGVGPEQNFSYIAALRPAVAFIIDIRRENLALHLLYKALFELSTDRADFVSRLFSRPRPPGLEATASVEEIFERYEIVPPSAEQHRRNVALVRERLLTTRGLPLSQADLDWIDRAFRAFYDSGPSIDYYGSRIVDAVRPSYRRLMTAKDLAGRSRSFLATDEGFHVRESAAIEESDRACGRRLWRTARHTSGGGLHPGACRPHLCRLRVERRRVSQQAADTWLLRKPCVPTRRISCLVHRQRWRTVAGLEIERLPGRSQVRESGANVAPRVDPTRDEDATSAIENIENFVPLFSPPVTRACTLGPEGQSLGVGGTSAAAPFVTGTVALLLSEFPRARATDIMRALTPNRTSPRGALVPPLLNATAAYDAMRSMSLN